MMLPRAPSGVRPGWPLSKQLLAGAQSPCAAHSAALFGLVGGLEADGGQVLTTQQNATLCSADNGKRVVHWGQQEVTGARVAGGCVNPAGPDVARHWTHQLEL